MGHSYCPSAWILASPLKTCLQPHLPLENFPPHLSSFSPEALGGGVPAPRAPCFAHLSLQLTVGVEGSSLPFRCFQNPSGENLPEYKEVGACMSSCMCVFLPVCTHRSKWDFRVEDF